MSTINLKLLYRWSGQPQIVQGFVGCWMWVSLNILSCIVVFQQQSSKRKWKKCKFRWMGIKQSWTKCRISGKTNSKVIESIFWLVSYFPLRSLAHVLVAYWNCFILKEAYSSCVSTFISFYWVILVCLSQPTFFLL